jgi:predicted phosphoadenosine phosphosulfate sulfurtransferase
MDESEIKTKIARETAEAMVILSPKKAADWVARMPVGEARSASMERVVSEWVEQDPVATAEWLNQFPNDQSIDGALAIFSHEVAEKQPQSALQWAQSIEDSERRERVIQYVKNK